MGIWKDEEKRPRQPVLPSVLFMITRLAIIGRHLLYDLFDNLSD